ncbi:MAG: hypothetical protein AMXMBFR57_21970 [Acidimicrobiia bacterium]
MTGVRRWIFVVAVMAAGCGSDTPATPTAPAPISGTDACSALGGGTAGGLAILSGAVCSPTNSAVVRVNMRTAAGGAAGICTGTVITSRAVLTAAHCLDEEVAAADVFLGNPAEPDFRATALRVYPGFVFNATGFDVAVMVFDRDIPRTPMPILTSRQATVGEAAVIAGWGRDENDVTTQLKAGSTTISAVSATLLQTVFAPPSASVCSGDSGGPILVQENGRWAIAGITSATSSTACNTGTNFYQAVFNTNVRNFIVEHAPTVTQR